MSAERKWDRARWLWLLALVGGISFFVAVFLRLDGPAIWAWKTTGVGFLALWAAANARGRDGWLIAAILGFVFFKERLSAVQVLGVVLVLVGAVVLHIVD